MDLGQPTFLVVKDTTLSLEPLDYISFWEFLTIMAFVMFSNSGLRDTDHPLGISSIEAISKLISKILFRKSIPN